MEISFIYPHALDGGGYPRDILWLASSLSKNGVSVTLYTNEGPNNRDGLTEDVKVVYLKDTNKNTDFGDVVHIFSIFIIDYISLFRRLPNIFERAVVVSPLSHLMPHAMEVKTWKKKIFLFFNSFWLKKVSFHAFSDEEEKSIEKYFPGRRVFQGGAGIYQDTADIRKNKGFKEEKILNLLFFGRNDVRHKGLDILLESISRAADLEADVQLTLAGQPWKNSDEFVSQFIEERKLHNYIEVVGKVDDDEKWRLLKETDYLVFFSRFDGPPRPIREALSVGTPVIVSPESNMGELVESYNAGLKVPLTPFQIAEAYKDLLHHPEWHSSFVEGALNLKEELKWDKVAQDYICGYRSILDK